MSSASLDALGLLRILMISGGTPFTRTSCFVVGNAVPVSPFRYLNPMGSRSTYSPSFSVHKLDYHGPEEGEHDHH